MLKVWNSSLQPSTGTSPWGALGNVDHKVGGEWSWHSVSGPGAGEPTSRAQQSLTAKTGLQQTGEPATRGGKEVLMRRHRVLDGTGAVRDPPPTSGPGLERGVRWGPPREAQGRSACGGSAPPIFSGRENTRDAPWTQMETKRRTAP